MERNYCMIDVGKKMDENDNKMKNIEKIIEYLKSMQTFTDDYIPSPPKLDPELYRKYVVPNFIRCGAIPKDRLVKGKTYFGDCRNSSTATWNGNEFEYERYKFGSSFNETINHFEDDDGYDLFVPIREINSE